MAHGNTSKEPIKIQIYPLLFIKYLIVIDKEKKKPLLITPAPPLLVHWFQSLKPISVDPHHILLFIYLFIFTPIHLLHAYKSLPSYTSLWRPLPPSLSDFFSFFWSHFSSRLSFTITPKSFSLSLSLPLKELIKGWRWCFREGENMGSCASVHNATAPESAMKLGVSFSSKKDKLVIPKSPINDNKQSTANPLIKTFGDFGMLLFYDFSQIFGLSLPVVNWVAVFFFFK